MNNIIEPDKNNIGGLWLGDVGAAENLKKLEVSNINCVLTILSGFQNIMDCLVKKYKANSIQHKFIEAEDNTKTDITIYIDECLDYITNGLKSGNVLVHCFGGASRSASMVIAYLMKTQNLSFEESQAFVKAKRKRIGPSDHFSSLLKDWGQKSYQE